MTDSILIAKNIVKQYGNHLALNKINISVPKGSIYGLLGPNGAGKTSLLNILSDIFNQDSGQVFIDGNERSGKSIGCTYNIGFLPEMIAFL